MARPKRGSSKRGGMDKKTRQDRHSAKRRLSAKHRKAISEGLRKFHARQREETTPRGYRRGKREIEPMLNRTMKAVIKDHGVDADIRRELNADASVDWELRIAIPKGVSIDDVLLTLADKLKGAPKSWIGIGVRFQSDAKLDPQKKADYERFRTALQVHAHYQRNTDRKIQTNVLGIQRIVESMRKNRRRKPHEIFVRIHWNLKGVRPE